jgi:PAS domain S-box-containing protein
MVDASFTIADVNERTCELYGLRRSEVIDRHCVLDFPEGERICHTRLVEGASRRPRWVRNRIRAWTSRESPTSST